MRTSHLLVSVIHLIISLIVIGVGVLFLIIPFANGVLEALYLILESGRRGFLIVGSVISTLGILLLLGFYSMHKKSYYKVQMGCSSALIEDSLIREYVQEYWQTLFPKDHFDLRVVVNKGQKLEVITSIPKGNPIGKEFFERVQNELGVLLARKLGYEKDFTLTITD